MKSFKEVIKENNLIVPNYNNLNILDLTNYLYKQKGLIKNKALNKKDAYLKEIIPNNKHILFVISDGTGSNIINKLDNNAILKKNKKTDLITLFPSTTACVLTSVVTNSTPLKHGIWGWFNYKKKTNLNYYTILYKDRETDKSLDELDYKYEDIFLKKSLLNNKKKNINILFSYSIYNSNYSKFVANDNLRYSYENYRDIVEFMKINCSTKEESFTYLYIPDIDTLEHINGIDSKKVFDKLKEIDLLIEEIANIPDLTIVFTADHGQSNVSKEVILDLDKYNKYFYALPSIDIGTTSYFVKSSMEEEFKKEFNNDFECKMLLFKKEDILKNIYKNKKINQEAFDNLGEYISICKKDYYLINSYEKLKHNECIKGNHTGLTTDELIIPLIVIDTNKG